MKRFTSVFTRHAHALICLTLFKKRRSHERSSSLASHLSPLARLTGLCLFLPIPLMTLPVPLNAAVFVWDPAQDQTGSGGAGTWDLSTPGWLSGGADDVWTNVSDDTAAFQGTGGQVTLAAGINAGGLSFDALGYTLVSNGSAQVLTLGAGGIGVGASSGTITIGDSNLTLAQPDSSD